MTVFRRSLIDWGLLTEATSRPASLERVRGECAHWNATWTVDAPVVDRERRVVAIGGCPDCGVKVDQTLDDWLDDRKFYAVRDRRCPLRGTHFEAGCECPMCVRANDVVEAVANKLDARFDDRFDDFSS